jgi:hypothetical protein
MGVHGDLLDDNIRLNEVRNWINGLKPRT